MALGENGDAAGAADAQARLSAVIGGSDDAIIATRIDGVITSWSRGAEALYGYTAEQAIGNNISLVYPESEVRHVGEILAQVVSGERTGVIEGTRRRADGTLIDVEVRVSPIVDDEGNVIGASSIARDIGERLQREQELRDNRAFLERTQAIGHIGSWKTRIGPESVFTWTAETYRIFGMEVGTTVRNIDFFNLVHADDRQLLVETLIKVRNDGRPEEVEIRFVRGDGALRWLFLAADAQFDETGVPIGITGVVQDITERKQDEIRLAHDALHDQLTGLPNRSLFLDRVARDVARAETDGSKVAVLYFDLDRFKLFNDAHDNERGDVLIRAVADRLRSSIKSTDTVARFGADEFGLVFENVASAADAAEIAKRLLSVIQKPFTLDAGEAFVTASIGIAVSGPGVTAEALVRDADLAMYRAKEQGRNRFELYDLELRHQSEQRFGLEAALRRALDNDELFLEYQPVASLVENRFVGAEALIRWHHPERGIMAPNDFIPVAEETGLIVPIGAWVLETACRQLREWRDASPGQGEWHIAVNVAGTQLRSPGFAGSVATALLDAGLDSAALRLELTESTFIDGGFSADVLRSIHDLGVRISIDDFGTKYSSLSYLTQLPIDDLKIDQSFVAGLAGDQSSRAIVAAILAIGRSLNLAVTAEGVETETQLAELRRLGCDFVQGFYFSKAVAPLDCLAVLRGRPEEVSAR